jgi:hypothetical protein
MKVILRNTAEPMSCRQTYVLLPIIIVGQNIQAKTADERGAATFKDTEAVLKESEEIQKHLLAQDEAISRILERIERPMPERAADAQ